MNEPVRKPAPGGSLLERAAKVYDLDAFRQAAPAEPAASARPAAQPFDGVARPAAQPFDGVARPAAQPFDGVARPAAQPFDESPSPSLAAIPAEFLAAGDHDDFVPPDVDLDVASVDRAMLAERGMIVPGAPIGPLAEEFRLVKRHLLGVRRLIDDLEKARTILVCSARPGDGKTFCAINLALSVAAERDTDVLLVDADFAKPDVCRQLGLRDGPGLLDALDDAALDPESLVIRTDVPGLSVLPAGTRTSADTELLASARTAKVIARLLEADPKRVLLFDSPPALAASPASVLAGLAGQVVLVVRADRTAEGEVREAVRLLDACEHVDLLLNAQSFAPGGHRFGDYYGDGAK